MPNYAAFAGAVLDEIGADRAVLVGTSLGGHILATVACEAPERVEALVLVGTLGMAPLGQAARERTAGLVGDASPETVDRKLHSVLHDDGLVTAELHREEVLINNSPGAAESFVGISDYFANRIDDDVVGERLAALGDRFGVLLVWGREDLGFPLSMGEAAPRAAGWLAPGDHGRRRPRPLLRAARHVQRHRHPVPRRPPRRRAPRRRRAARLKPGVASKLM